MNDCQVDPALVYAHTLQESVFRTKATNPAGGPVGVMSTCGAIWIILLK